MFMKLTFTRMSHSFFAPRNTHHTEMFWIKGSRDSKVYLLRHIYLLTQSCRVLLEQLTGLQLVKKFPAILLNPKVHYRIHKRPPPISILGQLNPVHRPISHLLEIHRNIIHLSTPRSPQWSLSLRFPHQHPIHSLSSPIRATCPAHLILLDFITRTILGEEYRSEDRVLPIVLTTGGVERNDTVFFVGEE